MRGGKAHLQRGNKLRPLDSTYPVSLLERNQEENPERDREIIKNRTLNIQGANYKDNYTY